MGKACRPPTCATRMDALPYLDAKTSASPWFQREALERRLHKTESLVREQTESLVRELNGTKGELKTQMDDLWTKMIDELGAIKGATADETLPMQPSRGPSSRQPSFRTRRLSPRSQYRD